MIVLNELNHPGIVKIFNVFGDLNRHTDDQYLPLEYQQQKQFMAVYELCSGGTLYQELKKNGGRIEEPKAVLIFTQILEALSYLHNKHICHRDIKLENFVF